MVVARCWSARWNRPPELLPNGWISVGWGTSPRIRCRAHRSPRANSGPGLCWLCRSPPGVFLPAPKAGWHLTGTPDHKPYSHNRSTPRVAPPVGSINPARPASISAGCSAVVGQIFMHCEQRRQVERKVFSSVTPGGRMRHGLSCRRRRSVPSSSTPAAPVARAPNAVRRERSNSCLGAGFKANLNWISAGLQFAIQSRQTVHSDGMMWKFVGVVSTAPGLQTMAQRVHSVQAEPISGSK